jgi:glycosyltransferase involved in cell wall biosynthesis
MADVVKIWSDLLDTEFAGENTRLIVVNDGSRDNTGKILDEIQPQYPKLIVVHQPNGGHGNAVVHAYRKAVEIGAEYVFQTDSDDQFIPEDVKKLWDKRTQSDFILGTAKYVTMRFSVCLLLVYYVGVCSWYMEHLSSTQIFFPFD